MDFRWWFNVDGRIKNIYDNYLQSLPLDGHASQFFINIEDLLLTDSRPIKICAKAGELVLWDSKMFHYNVIPYNKESVRMCIYVSM